MRKTVFLLISIVLMVSLCGCLPKDYHGDVSEVNIKAVRSEMYSQEEINAAIQVIIDEFAKGWGGCKLTEIYYAGDETNQNENKYYIESGIYKNADEMIVLESTFEVDASGGNGSLNPNSTYEHWNWLLVRSNGGTWKHVDHGYG